MSVISEELAPIYQEMVEIATARRNKLRELKGSTGSIDPFFHPELLPLNLRHRELRREWVRLERERIFREHALVKAKRDAAEINELNSWLRA